MKQTETELRSASESGALAIPDTVLEKAMTLPVEEINILQQAEGHTDLGTYLAAFRATLTPLEKGRIAATEGFGGFFSGQERRPREWRGWRELPAVPMTEFQAKMASLRMAHSLWIRGNVHVISSLAVFDVAIGPEWVVHVERYPKKRARPADLERVMRDFNMRGSFEDNHFPTSWRSFRLAMNPEKRRQCECLVTERTVTEPDGYRWTTPADGPCRGCVLTIVFGDPCPVHGASASGAHHS